MNSHTVMARVIIGLLILAYAAIRLAGYFGHASKAGLSRPRWWRRQRPGSNESSADRPA